MLMPYFQANLNHVELEKFQRMGEIAYAESCKKLAFDWIRMYPSRFVVVSLKRFFYYWNGVPKATSSVAPVDSAPPPSSQHLSWRSGDSVAWYARSGPGPGFFAGLVLTYPTVYYFVFPHARYRHPIEPELLILIVFLLSRGG